MSNIYLLNMFTCDVTALEDQLPDAKSTITADEAEKELKAFSSQFENPIAVEMKREGKRYFVYYDHTVPEEEEEEQEGGGLSVISTTFEDSKDTAKEKLNYILMCYEAFPLIKDKLIKKKIPICEKLFAGVVKAKKEFEARQAELNKAIDNCRTEDALKNLDTGKDGLKVQLTKLRLLLQYIIKPDEYPEDLLVDDPVPPVVDSAELKKLREENEGLKEDLKNEKNISDSLRKELDAAKKRIAELESKKPCHKIVDDPKIVGKEITFGPKEYPDGVVFEKKEGTFKYYVIDKELVAGLDPKKSAKCLVEKFEHHCGTKGDAVEIGFMEKYHMPKGEDFYICRGKVSQ